MKKKKSEKASLSKNYFTTYQKEGKRENALLPVGFIFQESGKLFLCPAGLFPPAPGLLRNRLIC